MVHTPRTIPQSSGNAPQASPVDPAERMDWEGGASHALPDEDKESSAIVPVDDGSRPEGSEALELRSALPFVLTTVAVGIAAILLLRSERGRNLTRSVLDSADDWSDKLDRFARSVRSVLQTLDGTGAGRGV